MNLVLFGPPGAGKGTQAERISAAWHLPHISTGQMLRDAVEAGTDLGRQVQAILDQGHLVPDDLVGRVVADRLAQDDLSAGFLLDGFPRTPKQVEILDAVMAQQGRRIDLVLALLIPDDVALRRLLGRAATGDGGKLRADDNETTIRKRLDVYARQTQPALDLYRRHGVLAEIDGTGGIDEVFARINRRLQELTS